MTNILCNFVQRIAALKNMKYKKCTHNMFLLQPMKKSIQFNVLLGRKSNFAVLFTLQFKIYMQYYINGYLTLAEKCL